MLKIIPTNEILSWFILYPKNPNATPNGHSIKGSMIGNPWIFKDIMSNKKLIINTAKTVGIRTDISPKVFFKKLLLYF